MSARGNVDLRFSRVVGSGRSGGFVVHAGHSLDRLVKGRDASDGNLVNADCLGRHSDSLLLALAQCDVLVGLKDHSVPSGLRSLRHRYGESSRFLGCNRHVHGGLRSGPVSMLGLRSHVLAVCLRYFLVRSVNDHKGVPRGHLRSAGERYVLVQFVVEVYAGVGHSRQVFKRYLQAVHAVLYRVALDEPLAQLRDCLRVRSGNRALKVLHALKVRYRSLEGRDLACQHDHRSGRVANGLHFLRRSGGNHRVGLHDKVHVAERRLRSGGNGTVARVRGRDGEDKARVRAEAPCHRGYRQKVLYLRVVAKLDVEAVYRALQFLVVESEAVSVSQGQKPQGVAVACLELDYVSVSVRDVLRLQDRVDAVHYGVGVLSRALRSPCLSVYLKAHAFSLLSSFPMVMRSLSPSTLYSG